MSASSINRLHWTDTNNVAVGKLQVYSIRYRV